MSGDFMNFVIRYHKVNWASKAKFGFLRNDSFLTQALARLFPLEYNGKDSSRGIVLKKRAIADGQGGGARHRVIVFQV